MHIFLEEILSAIIAIKAICEWVAVHASNEAIDDTVAARVEVG